jgi:hypothetical protein
MKSSGICRNATWSPEIIDKSNPVDELMTVVGTIIDRTLVAV